MDADELIEEAYWQENTTIFIDPPYVVKGQVLFHCYYSEPYKTFANIRFTSFWFSWCGPSLLRMITVNG